jgi:hypothetical protein
MEQQERIMQLLEEIVKNQKAQMEESKIHMAKSEMIIAKTQKDAKASF